MMKKVTKKTLNEINKSILIDYSGAFTGQFGKKSISVEEYDLCRIATNLAEEGDDLKDIETKIFNYINALLELKGYKHAYHDIGSRHHWSKLKNGSLDYLVYQEREDGNLLEDPPEGFELIR